MESNIFRKKSIDRISSPEQIDNYIKVTSTPVWLILAAVLVVLAGLIVWSIFGRITVNTDEGVVNVAPITYIMP